MKSYSIDYENGKQAEVLSYPSLKQLTKNPLTHNQERYSKWDFENTTTVIEHKSRECKFSDFSETMLEYSKINNCINENRRIFFSFRFTDGLYVIRYKKSLFDTFRTKEVKVPDREGYKDSYKEKIYIPTHFLTCLERFSHPLFINDD